MTVYHQDDHVTIHHGNALALPLDDASVDLICTSPPFFGLRSYQDSGEHYAGQIGSEATPGEFLDALIAATAEMVRVLKPSGSIWVNLGDKYAQAEERSRNGNGNRVAVDGFTGGKPLRGPSVTLGRKDNGVPRKSLIGIPWRYALRCIDDLGLILRAEVIWSKPNGLPESVTDRVRRSHEQWFWFQQSGDAVVPSPERLPFCPLCSRPVDARSTLVARLQELDASVKDAGLTDEVGPDERVEGEHGGRAHEVGVVGPGGSPVPLPVPPNGDGIQDASDLLSDRGVAAVDHEAQVRGAGAAVAESDAPLAVDDASEPGEVCQCTSHPLIVDDQPWIPQSLAAEIMQLVADGQCDPQHAADFLSGDYARTHSVWFHFTREPRYYSAVDEIREPHARVWGGTLNGGGTYAQMKAPGAKDALDLPDALPNPLGKLPGSVWTIPTEPLTVPDHLGIDHFAAFPLEWPLRIIRGWSPSGICTACGDGRRSNRGVDWSKVPHRMVPKRILPGRLSPELRRWGAALRAWRTDAGITRAQVSAEIRPDFENDASATAQLSNWENAYNWPDVGTWQRVEAAFHPPSMLNQPIHSTRLVPVSLIDMGDDIATTGRHRTTGGGLQSADYHTITGYACACPDATAPTRPALILDPFMGTGTTLLAAKALGRLGVGVDLSADYCRLAQWRCTDRGELAKAMRVEKPAPVIDGQTDLLEALS